MTSGVSQAGAMSRRNVFVRDFTASIVVFLVAMPLCMGIAIASGVPPEKGLITGIIGETDVMEEVLERVVAVVARRVGLVLDLHGGAVLVPSTVALLRRALPSERRGRAFGAFGRLQPSVSAAAINHYIRQETSRYLLPDEPAELDSKLKLMKRKGVQVNVNHLGEEILSAEEAEAHLRAYERLLAVSTKAGGRPAWSPCSRAGCRSSDSIPSSRDWPQASRSTRG